jgi:hypothetical protein
MCSNLTDNLCVCVCVCVCVHTGQYLQLSDFGKIIIANKWQNLHSNLNPLQSHCCSLAKKLEVSHVGKSRGGPFPLVTNIKLQSIYIV